METKTVRTTIDPRVPASLAQGRLDAARVDATPPADIAPQPAADAAAAMQDAAQFARRVRRRLGLSQAELASRIQVSLDTIRNWEQGKRSPTGAHKAPRRLGLCFLHLLPKHAKQGFTCCLL